ncbi:MAG: hypothetical protein HUU38_22625 [Anaerolineales bacterium]|nr:hypothetical protein [Anaerolineales bacterium]
MRTKVFQFITVLVLALGFFAPAPVGLRPSGPQPHMEDCTASPKPPSCGG